MPAADSHAPKILTAPTVTKLGEEHRGNVLIGGSHGGVYAGYLAAKASVRAVILNDAGGGLDDAGFGSLSYLDHIGLAAATVRHTSARIGDADDMARRGEISHVNATAFALGCRVGQTTMACADLMQKADMPTREPPRYEEARFLFSAEGEAPAIWGVDSASLLRPEDAGQVVLTASHGALLGGETASSIKHDVLACAFNDAGVGCDDIGISRLPALDQRGIAAVTVDCTTARIGDIRSAWDTGIISHANETAAGHGAAAGQPLQDFARAIRRAGA